MIFRIAHIWNLIESLLFLWSTFLAKKKRKVYFKINQIDYGMITNKINLNYFLLSIKHQF
jgi:hypothetical protein